MAAEEIVALAPFPQNDTSAVIRISRASFPLTDGYEVPLVYDPLLDPIPLVYLSINGSEPLPFLFDTGFTSLWVEPWAAKKIGLKPVAPTQPRPDGALLAPVDRLEVVTSEKDRRLRLDTSAVAVRTANIPDGITATRYAGIIGAPLCFGNTVRLDFARKRMLLFSQFHLPLHLPGAIRLPLGAYNPRDAADLRFTIPVKIGGEGANSGSAMEIRMQVDTGANFTTFDPKTGMRLSPLAEAPRLGTTYGLGVTRQMRPILLSQLTLGNQEMGSLYAQIATRGDANNAPGGMDLLGMNVLSQFVVTIDRRNRELWLEPLTDAKPGKPDTSQPRARVPADSTVSLTGSLGVYRVEELGKAALDAGLQPGDTLLEVDGHDLRSLPLMTAQRLLDGFAGTEARVVVLRRVSDSSSGSDSEERRTLTLPRFPLVPYTPTNTGRESSVRSPARKMLLQVISGG